MPTRNKDEEIKHEKPECNSSYFFRQSLSNEYIQPRVKSSQIVFSETEKPRLIQSKAQQKKLRTKNKNIEDHTKEDQILRNIFAAYSNENLDSNTIFKDIPKFNLQLILKIDDTLFKSIEILTNQHFGLNILITEDQVKIVDEINA